MNIKNIHLKGRVPRPSGQTPRYAERYPLGRRKTQAVRPCGFSIRQGTRTKRGNADQERERSP